MNLKKYLIVYAKFLHTSLASELEYKTNILIDLITAKLSLIGSIFFIINILSKQWKYWRLGI